MDDASKFVALIGLGVGGYFGYTQVLRPYLARKELERQARLQAAASGMSYESALAQLATSACQLAVAAKSGGAAAGNPLTNAGCKLLGTVTGKVSTVIVNDIKKNPFTGTMTVLAPGLAIPIRLAEHVPVLGTGVKAVESGTKKVLQKLKFWGLEGISC